MNGYENIEDERLQPACTYVYCAKYPFEIESVPIAEVFHADFRFGLLTDYFAVFFMHESNRLSSYECTKMFGLLSLKLIK